MPRALVHKAADGEVLLQDAVRTGDDRFTVAARLPRDHFLGHRGTAAAGDPLLLAEAVRQSAIYLSHRFYGVPEGHAFILSSLDFALDAPLPPGGPDAAPLVLEVTCTVAPRGPRRLGARLEAEVHCEGRRLGRVGARWQAVERKQYAVLRLRGGGTTQLPDVAPELSDRHAPYSDEVLEAVTGAEGQWRVRLDLGHPVLFDHLSDHIPGMVLIEGFRQAALTAADADDRSGGPLAAAVTFHAFGELTDPPAFVVRQDGDGTEYDTECGTEYGTDPANAAGNSPAGEPGSPAGREPQHFTAVQGGRTIASCTISVATRLPIGGPAC
ncbi:ScbA/BarX family gamma-butyrolactone biosynthesis protein [Streptomyces sp. NPDC059002]|uniref:ScbA/BarX family gamma-butyrolactone biosynthesis protein n=1 Tax=Streptomyces sp. NPDC059002 TaxID=3346690 RepID=UPI0036976331